MAYTTDLQSLAPWYWWDMDGDVTDRGYGSSSSPRNGTITNSGSTSYTTSIIPGTSRQCIDVTPDIDIDVADSPKINTGTGYSCVARSIQAWVKLDSISGTANGGRIIWEQGGSSRGVAIYTYNSQIHALVFDNRAVDIIHCTSATISTGTLYHVVCVFNMNPPMTIPQTPYMTLYINGSAVDTDFSNPIGAALSAHGGNPCICGSDGPVRNHLGTSLSGRMDGKIQDVAYWTDGSTNVNLSASQVYDLYVAGIGGGSSSSSGGEDEGSSSAGEDSSSGASSSFGEGSSSGSIFDDVFGNVVEAFEAGDTFSPFVLRNGFLVDGFVVGDDIAANQSTQASLTDGIEAGDNQTVDATFQASLTDGFVAGNAQSALITIEAQWDDGFVAGETKDIDAELQAALADGMVAGNVFVPLSGDALIFEGAVAGDQWQAQINFQVNLVDGVVAGDNQFAANTIQALIANGAIIGEDVNGQMVFEVALVDGMVAGGPTFQSQATFNANLTDGAVINARVQGVAVELPFVKMATVRPKVSSISNLWGNRNQPMVDVVVSRSSISNLGGKRTGMVSVVPSRSTISNLWGLDA